MPHIIDAEELAEALKLKDEYGNKLVPSASTDPSLSELNKIIDYVESEFETEAYQSFGEIKQTTEYHDLVYEWQALKGIPIYLSRTHCKSIDTDEGDYVKIKINNVLQDVSESNYHFNELEGIIWVRHYGLIDRQPRLEIKFRYGIDSTEVTGDVKMAIRKMAFINIVEGSIITNIMPRLADNIAPMSRTVEQWRQDIKETISRHRVFAYGR